MKLAAILFAWIEAAMLLLLLGVFLAATTNFWLSAFLIVGLWVPMAIVCFGVARFIWRGEF